MCGSMGVRLRDTGIGSEREGGVVKKAPMTHLKKVSAGNDTSTNIHQSKRPGKRSGAAFVSGQTKEVLLIKMATSRRCHTQKA